MTSSFLELKGLFFISISLMSASCSSLVVKQEGNKSVEFNIYLNHSEPYRQLSDLAKSKYFWDSHKFIESLLKASEGSSFVDEFTLWRDYSNRDVRLFIEIKGFDNGAIEDALNQQSWREIDIPVELLKTMHLSKSTPKDYMNCYFGRLNISPSYICWSKYLNKAMAIIKLD
ncbi:MAG: hypothetical protein HWD86_01645 [Kangiellaceae bacterium]|nr:hypothetical protein [Kangiellaceae bacterium]